MAQTMTAEEALMQAIALVYDAISAVQKALLRNPAPADERALNRRLAELQLQLAHLTEDLDAQIDRSRVWAGPTPAQVQGIAVLMSEAERLTTAALTQTAAVAFASRVLTLATEIAESA